MSQQDGKSVVKVDGDGSVLKCAKDLGSDCGYVPGAKVCGKCGAMPLQMKAAMMMDEDMTEEEELMEDAVMPKKMYGMNPKRKPLKMKAEDEEEDEEDEEELPTEDMEMPDEDMEMPDEDDEEMADGKMYGMMPKKKKGMYGDMSMDEDDEDDEDSPMASLNAMKELRLESLGYKSLDVGRNGYMCAVDRKVYPGGANVCEDCPGGCMSEKGMPGLLHVEGLAQDMFEGKIIDSGYSAEADMFVVDVETKDGRTVEVFVDGTNAEVLGWHKLDSDAFEQKSLVDEMSLIDFNQAAEIAVKSIEGQVVAVEPDVFEGYDTYAVEIDGLDGKSYDVFVALDGEVLGYDKYEPEESEEIEAEAAEIALKRAFSDEEREKMSKEGRALSDGSFPIANRDDLENAIKAYGRAKNKTAAKQHIMKRAQALGAESVIPTNWLTQGEKSDSSNDVKSDMTVADNGFLASLLEFELLNLEVDEKNS